MADTGHYSAPRHTVDDLFQYLVRVRGDRDVLAKKKIQEVLEGDVLRLDYHIRGGARKTQPMREATEKELCERETMLREQAMKRGSDYPSRGARTPEELHEQAVWEEQFHEVAPLEGIAGRVHFESWNAGRVFRLAIKDGHLVIEPSCALDFPWDAYDFWFDAANWELAHVLWPPSSQVTQPNEPPAEQAPAPKPEQPAQSRSTHLEVMLQRGLLKKPRQREIADCVLREFPPSGDTLPKELTASGLANKVKPVKTEKELGALRRACSRFLKNYWKT
jgi:hypothetical protein